MIQNGLRFKTTLFKEIYKEQWIWINYKYTASMLLTNSRYLKRSQGNSWTPKVCCPSQASYPIKPWHLCFGELSNLAKMSVDTVTYPAVTPVLVLPCNESRRREEIESRSTTSLTPGTHTSTELWPLLQLSAITSLQFGSSHGRSTRMFFVVLLSLVGLPAWAPTGGLGASQTSVPLYIFERKSKLKNKIYQILTPKINY